SNIRSRIIGPMGRRVSITPPSPSPGHRPAGARTVPRANASNRPARRRAMPSDAAAGPASRDIVIEILRYRSETDQKPVPQAYRVPFTDDMSVLQGLQYIKDHLDGSLTFRWSCRMAICGSCGKMVNGKPELSCHTFLRDYYPGKVRVEPLNHFPILRDLVIDQRDFTEKKLPAIKPYIVPGNPQPLTAG